MRYAMKKTNSCAGAIARICGLLARVRKREAKIILFQCNPFLAVPSYSRIKRTQASQIVRVDIM